MFFVLSFLYYLESLEAKSISKENLPHTKSHLVESFSPVFQPPKLGAIR